MRSAFATSIRRLLTIQVAPGLVFVGLAAAILAGPYLAIFGGRPGLFFENIGHFRLLGVLAGEEYRMAAWPRSSLDGFALPHWHPLPQAEIDSPLHCRR